MPRDLVEHGVDQAGFVALDEGVSMMTNIVDCDLDALEIGQAVRVVFKPTDGGPPMAMFTPA